MSALLPAIASELHLREENGTFYLETGKLYDPPLIVNCELPRSIRRRLRTGKGMAEAKRRVFKPRLRTVLRDVLIDMKSATKVDSSLFSASRLDLLSIRTLESASPDFANLEKWEDQRSIELPWINNLSVKQIVQLRAEASQALPRFRERIRRGLGNAEHKNQNETVATLREEAAELAAELQAANFEGETIFRNVSGSLGMTISVYGFTTGVVPESVALGSLLTLLGYLHTSAHKNQQEMDRLRSRPAYVLKGPRTYNSCST